MSRTAKVYRNLISSIWVEVDPKCAIQQGSIISEQVSEIRFAVNHSPEVHQIVFT